MKHFYLFLLLLFISSIGFSQTIALQDFEASAQTPVLNFSDSGGTYSTDDGPYPVGDNNFVSGSRGWEANNTTSTITFSSVDISAFSNTRLDFRLASFAGSSGNGNDDSDFVLVEVSLDGGASFSDELEINGNNNAKWSFDTGTGVATTPYDGDNNQTNFTPSAGGYLTSEGYSYISITSIPTTTQLVIRITLQNNSGNEYWIIDDVVISGVASSGPVNPTTFTATPLSSSQIDLAYDDNAAGDDIIIIFDTDNTFTTPTGSPTAVGTSFAGGTILYDSNGTGTYNHTGLTEGATYYYKAYSYDGAEYSSGLSADATTIINCPSITDLTIDSYTDTEAIISWTNGGTENAWEIVVQLNGSAVPADTPGYGTATSSNPHTVSSLSDNTLYEVYVRANCTTESNGFSTWEGPVTFTTEITPPQGSTCEDPINLGTLPYVALGETTNGFGDNYSGSPGDSGCGSTSSYLNGDDIVYAYTADEDGTINVNLTNITDNYTGVFIYDSCNDIGFSCQAGNVNSSSTADLNIPLFPVNNGQTYYIVVSTWADPQTTTYDLSITKGTSNLANIIESGFDEPNNIDYTLYDDVTSGLDDTNAIKIGEFTIQDAGETSSDSDALSTTLTDISFDIVGFANIAAIALVDDSTAMINNLAETSTVNATTSFSGLNIQAADDGTTTFSVYVTFDNTSVTDNDQIQLTVSAATANPSGSVFTLADAGSAETTLNGDDNKIEVTATTLIIDTNVSNVEVNAIMSPSLTVLAVDDEANVDFDSGNVTLTPSVANIFGISASYVEATVSGTATFNNLSFDTVGSGYTLTASSGSLTTDTSISFDVTPAGPGGGTTDLFFSEYIEGSSNNKCLEIYNGTGADVDLSLYDIYIYINGNPIHSPSSDIILSGTLIDGEVYVICDDGADTEFLAEADMTPTSNFYNGDDAVALVKNGVMVDLIGNIGCDPGSSWNEGGNNTANSTLVRNSDICSGITIDPENSPCDFPTLASEWTSFASDTVSNLGSHTATCGIIPTCNTFAGNGLTGSGGPVGNGSLEACAISGTEITFTFTKAEMISLNDVLVFYIDSETGGIMDTSGLNDTADGQRIAISGYNGTTRSTVTFPPGFMPEYAIALDNGAANLFQLDASSHIFIQDASLAISDDDYTFSIDFTNINTTPNSESFNILATYLSDTAVRSNESIGRTTATAVNPGASNPLEFETYYQVNSGFQGGKAPSLADGLWSESASWFNGNAPLAGDEITINNVITQDTDYIAGLIDITGANSLTVDSGTALAITGGVTGTGSINIDGKLVLTEGGYTNLTPTYGNGSTLEYRNISGIYNRFNEWNNGTSLGVGVPDNIIIENATLDITNSEQASFVDFTVGSNLDLLTNGSLTVDATESLTIGGDLNISAGNLDLNSISNDYSSLIIDGTATGDVIYKRHINTFANNPITGNNDLVSAPVTNANQTFSEFRNINTNIPSGTIGGVPSYLFGSLDNDTNVYINYTTANDNNILSPGTGYRTATNTATTTLTFVGDVQTSDVSVAINIGAASEWNLVGNPYPSYISSVEFLNENAALLDEDAVGIYGYDGDAGSGWRILNFNTTNSTDYNMAPGQGFLVAAESAGTVNFTTAMQTIIGDDDFIPLRTENNKHLRLQIEGGDANYETDFYFNDNSTLGLDPGYDASIYDASLPSFYLYSHLVENNTGRSMAIQSLGSTDLSAVSIPLGVHANQGEQITFSIVESTLPATVEVYLEDTIANTSTLLNSTDYILTPDVNLTGTGRFFLRYTEDALSTTEQNFNNLNIYNSTVTKEVVVAGQLLENTTCNIYDIQGRIVSTTELNDTTLENRIDVSTVSTGIYIVKLKNNNLEKTQKLVIK
ncbi:beta strand repeat-containing protein [Psychroserpens damuponensis]|uniref:beta strand repeat-containing protein n=1 Tax=Psychroserpens damuponensis TaxID=943936 RepID=UPI000590F069|nr:T9SS type A sorting domain-containing protein [Psychroserpens damuponensis]